MEIDKENERQDCNNDDLTIKRRSSVITIVSTRGF